MKNLALYSILILFLTSCNWFKKEEENSDETYTISGTMYDADGTTPLAGKTLRFDASTKAHVQNSFIKLGTTTTDSEGKFSITYGHFTQSYSDGISINQPHEELPVYGPFLRNIPINQDIARDICLVPRELDKFRIVLKGNLNKDTLYMASTVLPNEFKDYRPVNWGAGAVFQPLSVLTFPYESEIIVRHSEGSYNGKGLYVYYTTNRSNFDLAFNRVEVPSNFNDLVNTAEFSLETFPVVNTL